MNYCGQYANKKIRTYLIYPGELFPIHAHPNGRSFGVRSAMDWYKILKLKYFPMFIIKASDIPRPIKGASYRGMQFVMPGSLTLDLSISPKCFVRIID